ncbi:MAG: coenzyme F420-0:L-glutamate ligase [Candidatus Bathyarchaeia archaeon]
MKFKVKVFESCYWMPGYDFETEIASRVSRYARSGDYLVISEKAIATALGYLIDESKIEPSLSAKILAKVWVPIFWGYLLGILCGLRYTTLNKLRMYPYIDGARHKEAAIRYIGPVAALKHFSEGGLDVNNLPYSYASIPLPRCRACEIASRIRMRIADRCGSDITVVVVDSDHTFSWRSIHISSRPSIDGIVNLSTLGFIIGASLRWKARPTPIAVSGSYGSLEEVLEVCKIADKAMGYGLGRDIWDTSSRIGVQPTSLTWSILNKYRHKPYALVRRICQATRS